MKKRTVLGVALFTIGFAGAGGPFLQESGEEAQVKALVAQLDSEDPVQRENARAELARKGRGIAGHLKRFLNSPSGEVVAQVRGLLERFEWDELLERSLPPVRTVTLPKRATSPREIFDEIRRQTGYKVVPYAMNVKAPVELGWDRTPVLRVLDDLCRALGRGRPESAALEVRAHDSWHWRHRSEEERPPDQIGVDGDKALLPAVAHWNQFRAAVTDVVVTEQRSLKKASVDALVQVAVAVQPGTRPVFVGAWEVEEVKDDLGTSLLKDGKAGIRFQRELVPALGESQAAVWFTGERWSSSRPGGDALPIQAPSPGARKLSRLRIKLRASFPVREVTRSVPVNDFKENAVLSFGEATVTVTKAEAKDRSFHLHYTVAGTSHGSPVFTPLDKDGREVATDGGGSGSSGTSYQQHWYLRGGEVASVKTSAWVGHKTLEIPFEFTDVPLPAER